MPNAVTIGSTTNKVIVNSPATLVIPQNLDHTVTVGNTVHTLSVATPKVTLQLVQTPVAVSVQSDTIGVITAATQGPQGIQGPAGPPGTGTGDEINVLNKAERQDTVEDAPGVGDITVYYGIADPQSLDAAASWLITRQIYTADGEAFDSAKRFASPDEDQIWDNHLALVYT